MAERWLHARWGRDANRGGLAARGSDQPDPGQHLTTEELEACLYGELEKRKQEGPSQAELDRIVRRAEMGLIKKLENNDSLASEIGIIWGVTGDETAMLTDLDRAREVKPTDIQRVVKTYFTPQNRVVASLKRSVEAGPKDPLDEAIEGILAKAIGSKVQDAGQVKSLVDQQMGQIRKLPKDKREESLQQLQAQFGGK